MPSRAVRIALVLLALVALAVGIDNLDRPLANPDEGRYSEISREMAASGDWVTPRLNGIKYLEKPPLQYWASALSFRLFGQNEYSARLYVALGGALILVAIGLTAARLFGRETGILATVALASSPYFMALGGIVTLDMGLTLWTTLAFCAFLNAEHEDPESRARGYWLLGAWAAVALAVLSKGLVGLVIPAGALFLLAVARREARWLLRLEWIRGLALFFLVAAPWFVAVSLANPEFPEFFFIHEHFQRYLTTTHRRVSPWWYFLPILFAGFLPWMFALPAAAARAWREERASGAASRPLSFALLWSGFIVLFFSASSSKLPGYILPAFPPLALVLGWWLARVEVRRLGRFVLPLVPLALGLVWFAWNFPQQARDPWTRDLYVAARPWALAGVIALFAGATLAAVAFRRGRRWGGILVLALGTLALIDCVEDAYESLSPRQSGQHVARTALGRLEPGTRVYSVGIYDQTVPFYLGRTVTLVQYLDEFETGLKSEPGLAIADVRDFPQAWMRPGSAMAIIHPEQYERLRSRGLPMEVLHQDPRRVLVRKP